MNARRWVIVCLVLAAFALSIAAYGRLPSELASHWDAAGNVNGTSSRLGGALLMPFVMLGLAVLFLVIPLIDPLRKNIESFRKHYDWFVIVLLLFLLLVHGQTLAWNLGWQLSPNVTVPVGVGLLFIYLGFFFRRAKRNWFVGIRTPWTLSSDYVWDKTHRLGSKLFRIAGVLALLGVLFPEQAIWFVLIPVITVAVVTVVYSYVVYRQEG